MLALSPRQDDALYGRAVALKGEGDLAGALTAFREYVALPTRPRLQDAQNQLAALALRMKTAQETGSAPAQPANVAAERPAAVH